MSFEDDIAYVTGAAAWLDAKQQEAYQDRLDGAALRRLREAAGMRGWDVFPDIERWGVYIEGRGLEQQWFYGATIAEAADKCIEALKEK